MGSEYFFWLLTPHDLSLQNGKKYSDPIFHKTGRRISFNSSRYGS